MNEKSENKQFEPVVRNGFEKTRGLRFGRGRVHASTTR